LLSVIEARPPVFQAAALYVRKGLRIT